MINVDIDYVSHGIQKIFRRFILFVSMNLLPCWPLMISPSCSSVYKISFFDRFLVTKLMSISDRSSIKSATMSFGVISKIFDQQARCWLYLGSSPKSNSAFLVAKNNTAFKTYFQNTFLLTYSSNKVSKVGFENTSNSPVNNSNLYWLL